MNDQNLHIVSDGTTKGTKVFDCNGDRIPGISEVVFKIGVEELSEATLTFKYVSVDLKIPPKTNGLR